MSNLKYQTLFTSVGESLPTPGARLTSTALATAVVAAPVVELNASMDTRRHLDPSATEVKYNPRYDELYAPVSGPANPFKTQQQAAHKNTLAGLVEDAHVNEFQFETQRRTFHSYGFAYDPSTTEQGEGDKLVGSEASAADVEYKTVFEDLRKRPLDKRKKEKNNDPSDIDGYLGPWAKYADEETVSRPKDDDAAYLEEYLAKRQKKSQRGEEEVLLEEKSVLHVKDTEDYQGRGYTHVPQDLGVNLKPDHVPHKCFIPKRQIHTWAGHKKGVSVIRWFPSSAHLIMSGSMDATVKLYEVYGKRRLIRTFTGHKQAIRDVKFNPNDALQHLIVAGTSSNKIVCWDTRSGDIVQEYDRHLAAVNTITFVDRNRRFVSTSDDKSLRVWEWNIPVDMKYIADPSMHSMPCVTPSPNGKFIACQSLDNRITIYMVGDRFKEMRKKVFKGHMVAGYACGLDFSPEMSYLCSGDGDGTPIYGTGKLPNFYRSGRHTTTCVFRCCGTLTRPARWPPLGGTALSSFGIDVSQNCV